LISRAHKFPSVMDKEGISGVIKSWQIKKLLIDLHTLGEDWRTVRFQDICNNAPYVYGKTGDPLRRKFQKKYTKIKHLSEEAFTKFRARHLDPDEIKDIEKLLKGEAKCIILL
jgi:hypothetical protein